MIQIPAKRAKLWRIGFTNDARYLFRRSDLELVGPLAGQDLVKQNAERVNIRDGCDRLTEKLRCV